ncbi:T9SS type A sorting domain-containing protein [Ichthyenterobacterium sp. W332]|uniref:T9SS type A sorting domain-containing protein n=1 Tax=Microcosmobacter mediterraneus TaxID=3075607 RepID=A0ABU2YII5_9FLAO|nr:T9SS type A sorting domain-containing protein [Ichthyenterobacterium sp. W332]MDT0557988.1 T9SS type A sorting domain-containing protein [Ichthyenterobacterium sp. W332]
MKTKLVLLLGLLYSLPTFAQTDGWYLYTKASEITKIVPDEVNSDELHLATDIGYIKYNTSANTVTDFCNLTSQNPAIGKVKDVAQDPTSDNLAFALVDGIAIYNGINVTIYNYDNSDLSIGEFTNQFLFLELEYAKDGSLYIFKEDAFGYQKFDNGAFESEQVTSFRPKDIIENIAGTKTYFAGDVNGLWELEKATDTWTNYTSSNSDLISNFVLSLAVDSNDLLYVGGFQGINTLSDDGVWNTYQELDPINAFPYQAHSISVNESTGHLVVSTSAPSTYYFGLSIVDLNTNTWTNYREDDTNCLNENVYTATVFGGDGKVYAAPIIFSSIPDIGKLVQFTPSSETCINANINYLNAPVAVNSNVVTDFAIREKTNGNFEIGFTRSFDLHAVEIDPMTFNGSFPTPITLTPSAGDFLFSIINDNNHFIVEANEGWLFIDENNAITTFNHSIPDYLAIVTKKSAIYNSENGIINIVHKGFDASFNYRAYKTQCNTLIGTCAPSEEIFTTDRDLSQNVLFGTSEATSSDNIYAVGISLDTSVDDNFNNDRRNSNALYTEESWNKNTNGNSVAKGYVLSDILFPNSDPLIIRTSSESISTVLLLSDNTTIRTLTENDTSNELISRDFSIDQDNNGEPDEIINSFVTITYAYGDLGTPVLFSLVKNSNGTHIIYSVLSTDETGDLIMENVLEQQGPVSNNLTIRKTLVIEETPAPNSRFQNNNTATIAILTNYGLLLKTDLDLSQLTLSDNNINLSENNFTFFPNPTKDLVNIGNDSINKILVFDANGRLVFETNKTSFSMKHLEVGVYFVKVESTDGQIINGKVIKR